MDNISRLPDDLLVKILSFVPTKLAVSTSILSKRWEFLWMWLPKLEYISSRDIPRPGLRDFIDKNLPLNKAPVIESLCLGLRNSEPEDIKRWVEIAVSRSVRELEVSHYSSDVNVFPNCFYTCKSLVFLKLNGMALMDSVALIDVRPMDCFPSLKTLKLFRVTLIEVPATICFPSVKSLQLRSVTYEDNKSLQWLLSSCPALEDLYVYCDDHDMKEFTIIVPTLQSLSLLIPNKWHLTGYVIDTPSLRYLKLEDFFDLEHYSEIKDIPELREAYVDVLFPNLKSVVGSITSVKRLTICSEIRETGGEDDGFVFKQLEHLKLCLCKKNSSNLLAQLLKNSSNLRVLDLYVMNPLHYNDDGERNGMVCWNQPTPVPECLLSSLQIFNWSRYFGRPQERDIAVYILKHACHLKTATILADTIFDVSNLEIVKELKLSSQASSTCELLFVEDDRGRSD